MQKEMKGMLRREISKSKKGKRKQKYTNAKHYKIKGNGEGSYNTKKPKGSVCVKRGEISKG